MKKELIVGAILSVIVVAMVIYFAGQYSGINQRAQNYSGGGGQDQAKNSSSGGVKLTAQEVATHNNPSDCWFIISSDVYDVTNYANQHPGGAQRITNFCGKDATLAFGTKGGQGSHSNFAEQQLSSFLLGMLDSSVTQDQIQSVKNVVPQNFGGERQDKEENDYMNTRIYLFCRQIHRLLVLVISVMTLLMAATGGMLKYSAFISNKIGFINLGLVRYVHNNLSPYYSTVLVLMAATGLYMYFFSLSTRKKQEENQNPSTQP